MKVDWISKNPNKKKKKTKKNSFPAIFIILSKVFQRFSKIAGTSAVNSKVRLCEGGKPSVRAWRNCPWSLSVFLDQAGSPATDDHSHVHPNLVGPTSLQL